MEKIINTIFPSDCIFCGRSGSSFCKVCLNKCLINTESKCLVCQKKTVRGQTHALCNKRGVPSMLFSPFVYEGLVRECIRRSKYNLMEFDSLKVLAERGIWYFLKNNFYFSDYVATPIPLSKKKERKRGFNQAEIISKKLAKMVGLKHESSILVRSNEARAQFGYSREERKKNLKGAFFISSTWKDKIADMNIMLVDDICTTGTTLLEASKVLYKAGAKDVKCFTLSYVL